MTNIMERIKIFLKWLRSCITPGYITMLVAAFILWYMTKLGETYTTDHDIEVVVDGQELDVRCTIRGKGTNLIGYTFASKSNSFDVPAAELSFDGAITDNDGRNYRQISSSSMQRALAARMPDIEVVAVGVVPPLEITEQ